MHAGVESKKGFTQIGNGVKRHLTQVGTLGYPFFTHCTRVNVSDDADLVGY